ncbi:ammonium transporter Rh type B-like [Arapaima gigas]
MGDQTLVDNSAAHISVTSVELVKSGQSGILGLTGFLGLQVGDDHTLILEAVDELAPVAPVVLELQVCDAKGSVQNVCAAEGGPVRQRPIHLLCVAVGNKHHVLEAMRQQLHLCPPHLVVWWPGAQ